jgi:2-C-methyl-D-erythritol 4-phosphate cytidylyltransferase
VANGLAALRERGASDHDWVLVHDAARCLLRPAWVERLITACAGDEVGGLLALPVSDTLKREHDGRVLLTRRARACGRRRRRRCSAWACWSRRWRAPAQVTDEASAIEALGLRPRW